MIKQCRATTHVYCVLRIELKEVSVFRPVFHKIVSFFEKNRKILLKLHPSAKNMYSSS